MNYVSACCSLYYRLYAKGETRLSKLSHTLSLALCVSVCLFLSHPLSHSRPISLLFSSLFTVGITINGPHSFSVEIIQSIDQNQSALYTICHYPILPHLNTFNFAFFSLIFEAIRKCRNTLWPNSCHFLFRVVVKYIRIESKLSDFACAECVFCSGKTVVMRTWSIEKIWNNSRYVTALRTCMFPGLPLLSDWFGR